MCGRVKRSGIRSTAFYLSIIIVCSAGIVIGADLTYVHYKSVTDASYHSFCAISDSWNCQTVAGSPYSVFLRVPISLWGVLLYVLYIFLSVTGIRAEREKMRGFGFIFLMGIIGVMVSGVLFWISTVVINSKCILCVGLYFVNIFVMISSIVKAAVSKLNPVACFVEDLKFYFSFSGKRFVFFGFEAIVAVLLIIFYPFIYGEQFSCSHEGSSDQPEEVEKCNEDATYGPEDAKIVITEFSDYECPYCAVTHFALRKAVEEFSGKVMLKHRHFPLDISCNPLLKRPFHKYSCMASKAAVCAGKQGHFWEFNDLLWRNQKRISPVTIRKFAEGLGLDMEEFEKCMEAPTTEKIIKDDIKEATNTPFVSSGLIGTPIIYIGNQPHIGGLTYKEVEKIIREQLEKPKQVE